MRRLGALCAVLAVAFAGCETVDPDFAARAAMNEAIAREQPGNFYVGRRMFKRDYKVWGWVREPGKPWKTARLVMLNEQTLLAPDRQQDRIGFDNNYEYILRGRFSGQTVYEPASDGFYPEFIVEGFEVRDANPPNIYKTRRQGDSTVRILQPPI